ncbi:glycosyltransferase [Paraburkholderia dilworthii]|uniref:glycosyltransferase n=1 Tax=Paraburkholderia dilworthii TaxID=948106 RepID=UPI001FCB9A96|nr:glycosyltransferase [Paraburkholderia dilworthii]
MGGAETLLLNLVSESRNAGGTHVVISLSSMDTMADRLRAAGAEVRFLGMRRGVPNPLLLIRLARWIVDARPDVVQTWMYHADVVGGVAALLARQLSRLKGNNHRFALVWGIHRTEVPTAQVGRLLNVLARIGAMTSNRLPDSVVCCANASLKTHVDYGYERTKMRVVHNGFDVRKFVPDANARSMLLSSLGLPPHSILIGIVGRSNPAKDYDNFLHAAAMLRKRVPVCHFVMVGKDVDADNKVLGRTIDQLGLSGACHLLGARNDLQRIMPAFDMLCLSSRTEGLPTVVGEAMACSVPCVVTDVGDTGQLVGDTGLVVPPRDPVSLSKALEEMATLSLEQRKKLGERARERIVEQFSITVCWQKYREMYTALLRGKGVTH